MLATVPDRPVVLTDLTVRPFDTASIADVSRVLVNSCDAVLVGEHQNRPDFPPAVIAQLLAAAGMRAWVTLTCRDRNRLVLEQEIGGLMSVGVDGVLCVTGDGRAQGVRPGVTQVFDLDGTRLASMASAAGLSVAVAESPQARPTRVRPGRLVQKQRAGARVALLNHAGSPAAVEAFVVQARDLGLTIPVIAGVAVYTDARSAAVLQNFPGLHLDPARVAAVLGAADPLAAGIEAAVEEALELLAIDGIDGVNISGLASDQGEVAAAHVKAAVGNAVRQSL
jgi:5,10-methylenetetrahydrofolate reductase